MWDPVYRPLKLVGKEKASGHALGYDGVAGVE